MSVDIDILPLLASSTWRTLLSRWRLALGDDADRLLGAHPSLRRLGTNEEVGLDERLVPPLTVYFDLPAPNTLSLTAMKNQGNLSEPDYVTDYGRNLSHTMIVDLVSRWRKAGYSLGISTAGGRSMDEPRLFVTLALALSDATGGVVTVMHDGALSHGVGVYSPSEFKNARWNQRLPR